MTKLLQPQGIKTVDVRAKPTKGGITYLVVAGTHEQFMKFAWDNRKFSRTIIEVRNIRDVLGRSRENSEIIKIGTWYENHEAVDSLERYLGRRT